MRCGRIRDEQSGLFAVAFCEPAAGPGWLRFVLTSLSARLGSGLNEQLFNLETSGRLSAPAIQDYELAVLQNTVGDLIDWQRRFGVGGGFSVGKFFPDRAGSVRGYVMNVGPGAVYALENGGELVRLAAAASEDSEILTLRLGPGDRFVLAAAPLISRFLDSELVRLLRRGAHGDNAAEALLWQALDRTNDHYRHAALVWTCPPSAPENKTDALAPAALLGRLNEIEATLLRKPATLERLKMEMEVARLRYWLAHHDALVPSAAPGFVRFWQARRAQAAQDRHGEEYWEKKCAHDLFARQAEDLQWDNRRRALRQKVTDIVKITKR